ncbi:MAG: hypothetical protein JWQ35_2452 [Bacteriovoracaceae bacterium]|nr:hypothetical protein [Bacteriovoracaceae bacterium]
MSPLTLLLFVVVGQTESLPSTERVFNSKLSQNYFLRDGQNLTNNVGDLAKDPEWLHFNILKTQKSDPSAVDQIINSASSYQLEAMIRLFILTHSNISEQVAIKILNRIQSLSVGSLSYRMTKSFDKWGQLGRKASTKLKSTNSFHYPESVSFDSIIYLLSSVPSQNFGVLRHALKSKIPEIQNPALAFSYQLGADALPYINEGVEQNVPAAAYALGKMKELDKKALAKLVENNNYDMKIQLIAGIIEEAPNDKKISVIEELSRESGMASPIAYSVLEWTSQNNDPRIAELLKRLFNSGNPILRAVMKSYLQKKDGQESFFSDSEIEKLRAILKQEPAESKK